ncbi:hypothetical protein B0H13DRAFT_2262531, partial [Mycena leptocephala]
MPVLRAVFQFVHLALCFHCQDNILDYSPRAPTEDSLLHRHRDLLRYNSIISEDLMTPKFDTILEYQLRGTKHLDIIVLYTDGSVYLTTIRPTMPIDWRIMILTSHRLSKMPQTRTLYCFDTTHNQ